jgi:hypothetical protein
LQVGLGGPGDGGFVFPGRLGVVYFGGEIERSLRLVWIATALCTSQ